MSEKESECPIQEICGDLYPTESGKTCIHYSVDEYGNGQCHQQYDEEEWALEGDDKSK